MNDSNFNPQKVDLRLVLIAAATGMGSGELTVLLAQHFGCSERAIKDGFTVLRRGGYVVAVVDERDRRRRVLEVTARGARVALSPYGGVILRLARRLFTTCPSPAVADFQRSLSESQRAVRLARAETALLERRAA